VSLTDCDRISRTDPTDPRFTLLQNLQLVRSGVKSRAPGIRRCPDCDESWIDDHTGLTYCPTCRIGHWQRCRMCHAQIAITVGGNPLCDSCTDQIPLF
jgi:hypothetical protein